MRTIVSGLTKHAHWVKDQQFEARFEKFMADPETTQHVQPSRSWALVRRGPEYVRRVLTSPLSDEMMFSTAAALDSPEWLQHSEGLDLAILLMKRNGELHDDYSAIRRLFADGYDPLSFRIHYRYGGYFKDPRAISAFIQMTASNTKIEQDRRESSRGENSGNPGEPLIRMLEDLRFRGTDEGMKLVEEWIDTGTTPFIVVSRLLSQEPWSQHPRTPELLAKVLDRGVSSAISDDLGDFHERNWPVSNSTLRHWVTKHLPQYPLDELCRKSLAKLKPD